MTATIDALDADRQLKAKHRAMWALGNYPELVTDLISGLGRGAGEREQGSARGSRPGCRGRLGQCGNSGGADRRHRRRLRPTPELFDAGRSQAAVRGATLSWETADAEALAFPDGEFDIVMSCVGVMFAPHHQTAADELIRVCRTGGTIGLLSWTPGGFVGQLFATMKPYAPPPPAGAQPPPLWGSELHVRELFGDRVTDIAARIDTLTVDHVRAPGDFREYSKSRHGPTIAVYRSIADDPQRVAALDADIDALVQRFRRGDGTAVIDWEYLVLTGTKA